MEVSEALQVADDDLQEDELVTVGRSPSLALVLEHLQTKVQIHFNKEKIPRQLINLLL